MMKKLYNSCLKSRLYPIRLSAYRTFVKRLLRYRFKHQVFVRERPYIGLNKWLATRHKLILMTRRWWDHISLGNNLRSIINLTQDVPNVVERGTSIGFLNPTALHQLYYVGIRVDVVSWQWRAIMRWLCLRYEPENCHNTRNHQCIVKAFTDRYTFVQNRKIKRRQILTSKKKLYALQQQGR